jgi:hypothetical protein
MFARQRPECTELETAVYGLFAVPVLPGLCHGANACKLRSCKLRTRGRVTVIEDVVNTWTIDGVDS